MSEYIPIPVLAAKSLADTYNKQSIVILAWDEEHGLTHTTTYGTTPFHKENAAAVGRIATKAIGMDLGKAQWFEDFHTNYNAAKYKSAIELLEQLEGEVNRPSPEHERIVKFLTSLKP